MTRKQISTAADFPRLAVFEQAGATGPVYSIVFDNLEFGGAMRAVVGLIALIVIVISPVGIAYFGVLAHEMGVPWIIGSAVFAVPVIVMFVKLQGPWRIRRAIELDMGKDQLLVLRDGRAEIARPLSRLANLTVEEHPEAEFKRQVRAEKGEKTLSNEEKQHCLIGWFGVAGAERVMLLTRVEWPSQQSLFEVRQAILWVIQRAAGPGAPELIDRPAAPAQQQSMPRGLNPPLD